jgi:hypothetical protein
MREIGPVRQDSGRGSRRWFQDDYFDLFVWQDAAGKPIAFQLCYERTRAEGAISWNAETGFDHARVDAGAERADLRYGMSPMLRPNGVPPYFRIYNRFLAAAADWDPSLKEFMLARLREYRRALFGVRRMPRRPRAARRGHGSY